MKRRILAGILACTLCLSTPVYASTNNNTTVNNTAVTDVSADDENESTLNSNSSGTMTDKQLSSISMLNHMTVLSQEINASSNSKLYLDNAYSSIVNNINPNAVDSDSMSQIRSLLNTINAYQSIETKRERLQYIYEQNQANALRKAIPSPMSVLNVVQSGNPAKALISVVYMAVDSADSYNSYLTDVENKYMQDGWVLDDSAAQNLHESRSDAFTYMVEMCQKNGLDGKLALNEKAVEEFVSWENNKNTTRRIDFLEKNKTTYQAYGKYWLVLAESYYDQKEYTKCIEAIETYESMHIDTFRKDHDLAKALAIGIAAAGEVYNGYKYTTTVTHFLDLILENIETEDWALRYLAAQSYMDLAAKANNQTDKKEYLQKAYDLAEENVNYLIDEQYVKNDEYLAPVKKEESKKTDTKAKKDEIKTYNKWLDEERKIALPPVYQPLVVNCDLLFGLAKELNVSDSQKTKINNMLHSGDTPLFLIPQLESKYWFDKTEKMDDPVIELDGNDLSIPAAYIAQGTTIKVTVTHDGKDTVYEDWTLDEVKRGKKGGIETFVAEFESKSIKKQDYSNGDIVKVEIIPVEESTYDSLSYKLKATVTKKLKFLTNVSFEMVK